MPDTQMKIFLSHSSADNAVCDQLVGALRGAGADVWYDEQNLGAGALLEEIQRELQARPVFVVLLSKSAFASQWVRRETTWAFNLANREPNRLLLPITVGAIEASDFNGQWLFLEDYKRVEARGMQPHPHAELVAQTLRLLALTPKGQARVTVTPQPAESLAELLTQGRALNSQQKYAEALPFFQRAALADPNSFDAWFNLSYTLSKLDRWAEALPAAERATTLDPNSAGAWTNKGNALNGLKRSDEALAAHEQALALNPNSVAAWNNTGATLYALKLYDEALAAYEQALSLDSNFAYAWEGKAITLTRAKRFDEALTAHDQALSLDPSLASFWTGKGETLWWMERYDDALNAYDQALPRPDP